MSALIEKALALLHAGKLIGLPTETVYGLAADAKNKSAVSAVFAAKNRPPHHPLIVHIGRLSEIKDWATHIPEEAYQLAEHYWPGPLTLVLEKKSHVLDEVTGNQNTVALRMPNHPLALELLHAYGSGLVAPSANRFGCISPTDEAAVWEELGNQVSLILPGGRTKIGIESTILGLHHRPFILLREGMITRNELENFLGQDIIKPQAENTLRSPGLLASHYAPRTPLHIIAKDEWKQASQNVSSAVILSRCPAPPDLPSALTWCLLPEEAPLYAHELYATLRQADSLQAEVIFVEALPITCAWEAILDRLLRAAHSKQEST